MRIITGTLGGRLFGSPNGPRTHPMSDRARGALFNALGDITGLSVLDAFAGTGALSFEAVSRGASHALAIESDAAAQRAIADNIMMLGVGDRVRLVKAMGKAWLKTNTDVQFDIVLCDPPYDDLQPELLALLAQRVKPGGLLVLSWPSKIPIPSYEQFELIRCKDYAGITLAFFRNHA